MKVRCNPKQPSTYTAKAIAKISKFLRDQPLHKPNIDIVILQSLSHKMIKFSTANNIRIVKFTKLVIYYYGLQITHPNNLLHILRITFNVKN